MSAIGRVDSPRSPPSVFLSYASEDRPAAQAIRDALPTFGLEVWYDESGLDGGDAWDQKIRRQIRECDFCMPLISSQTAARPVGYFRREWRLAVERTLDMADDHTFLLPVVIDDTIQAGARVPEKFLTVQWLRVPGGRPTAALEAVCRRLASGQPAAPQPARKTSISPPQLACDHARANIRNSPGKSPDRRYGSGSRWSDGRSSLPGYSSSDLPGGYALLSTYGYPSPCCPEVVCRRMSIRRAYRLLTPRSSKRSRRTIGAP